MRRSDEAFAEPDIFRIDDYLGKEPVQNLVYFRFANSFLAPLWNRDHVASVQITMSEAFDVAGRGAFHEQPGAIREGEPDRVFVDLDLAGLALDAVVEVRLGVAPVASGGGGLEDLASVGVAVPPDMADKAAAASAAGEQASERVLPAVDGPALPPAVPRPQLLHVLPGGGRAPWT